jgi:hypothetical protein
VDKVSTLEAISHLVIFFSSIYPFL